MRCRLPGFAIHGEMAQKAIHTGWYDTKSIHRVERKESEVLLVELVSLPPIDYCFPEEFTKVMLNIPSALLMRRPIASHGAFGAYANPYM